MYTNNSNTVKYSNVALISITCLLRFIALSYFVQLRTDYSIDKGCFKTPMCGA